MFNIHNILASLSPIISFILVKKMFNKIGLGNIMSLGGMLGAGTALGHKIGNKIGGYNDSSTSGSVAGFGKAAEGFGNKVFGVKGLGEGGLPTRLLSKEDQEKRSQSIHGRLQEKHDEQQAKLEAIENSKLLGITSGSLNDSDKSANKELAGGVTDGNKDNLSISQNVNSSGAAEGAIENATDDKIPGSLMNESSDQTLSLNYDQLKKRNQLKKKNYYKGQSLVGRAKVAAGNAKLTLANGAITGSKVFTESRARELSRIYSNESLTQIEKNNLVSKLENRNHMLQGQALLRHAKGNVTSKISSKISDAKANAGSGRKNFKGDLINARSIHKESLGSSARSMISYDSSESI